VLCSRRAENAVKDAVTRVAAVQEVYTALAVQLQGSMVDFMAEVERNGGSLDTLRQKLKFLGQCKAQVESVTSGQVGKSSGATVLIRLKLLMLWPEL
jgi:hypothetical protein